MGKTLSISDGLYARLEFAAHQKGLSNIVQLLEIMADRRRRFEYIG